MSYIQPNQRDLLGILKYPILTEKTIRLLEQNQYSFAVDPKADKTAVKYAVEQLFDVKVISVNTSLLPLTYNLCQCVIVRVTHYYITHVRRYVTLDHIMNRVPYMGA